MSKRSATSELNHDNWDDEEQPEEAGTFARASSDALSKRVIRTARRRGAGPVVSSETNDTGKEEAPKSVFALFRGFGKSDTTETNKNAKQVVFSFLSANPKDSNLNESTENSPEGTSDVEKKSVNGVENSTMATDSLSKESSDREYYRKLKGLNESVSKWIFSHVSNNPLCILTPVFRDYEKHLANIQSAHCKGVEERDSSKDNVQIKDSIKEETEKEDKAKSEEKTDPQEEKLTPKSIEEKPTFTSSIFGGSGASTASATFCFGSSTVGGGLLSIFGSKSPNTSSSAPAFSFGSGGTSSPSAGFSFGSKPFTFANVGKPETDEDNKGEDGEEEETPPKLDHKPVNEDGAVYTKRCKVFFKKDSTYSDRGVGNLFLKPVEGGKTQLIVRADTSLGNVLLNILLSPSLPVQRVGTNNVAVVYVPPPQETQQDGKQDEKQEGKPVTVLLRVKTSADADELIDKIEKHKQIN